MILGSGFGDVVDLVERRRATSYGAIPGFPVATVAGHRGRLLLGTLYGWPVAILDGRIHRYEGLDDAQTTFPVRILHALGCSVLVVTNACGGITPGFVPGDLMLIADHIDFVGLSGGSPLRGSLATNQRTPFVAMKDAYDPLLRRVARQVARALGIELREGVYARDGGPSYETPAELRMLQRLGADAVGMSTTHEVVVARYLGLRVIGISCVTNAAFGDTAGEVAHRDVLAAVHEATPRFQRILSSMLVESAFRSAIEPADSP